MIERAPRVVVAPEPITMAGVQAMIQMVLDHQMEETRLPLQQNRDEPTVPIVQPELKDRQSEEGNYSRTVSQVEPRVARRNQPNGGNDGCGCKYKDFMASKPPSLSRIPTPVEFMDWIFEMMMMFESCNCSNKQKTALAVTLLKTGVFSWWKLLVDTMPKG